MVQFKATVVDTLSSPQTWMLKVSNAMNEERDNQIVSFLRREIVKMVLIGDIEHSPRLPLPPAFALPLGLFVNRMFRPGWQNRPPLE